MKRLSTLIIATTLSLAATAQREIQTLFDRIDSLPGQNLMAKDNYSDHNDLPTTYCHYSYITLAKSTFGDLDQQIIQAFTTQPKAYRIFRKTRDMRNTNSEVLVTYGLSLEYKIIFGSHDAHNYLVDFYRDSLDTAKRHAYAIVWYTEADQVHLLRYHIYGDDPDTSTTNAPSPTATTSSSTTAATSSSAAQTRKTPPSPPTSTFSGVSAHYAQPWSAIPKVAAP